MVGLGFLGGRILLSPVLVPHGSHSVGQNTDGRLEVFIWSQAMGYAHISQTKPGGPWGQWYSIADGVESNAPSVAGHIDGTLEVFRNPSAERIIHKSQTSPGSSS
jgi:hypothetical protein